MQLFTSHTHNARVGVLTSEAKTHYKLLLEKDRRGGKAVEDKDLTVCLICLKAGPEGVKMYKPFLSKGGSTSRHVESHSKHGEPEPEFCTEDEAREKLDALLQKATSAAAAADATSSDDDNPGTSDLTHDKVSADCEEKNIPVVLQRFEVFDYKITTECRVDGKMLPFISNVGFTFPEVDSSDVVRLDGELLEGPHDWLHTLKTALIEERGKDGHAEAFEELKRFQEDLLKGSLDSGPILILNDPSSWPGAIERYWRAHTSKEAEEMFEVVRGFDGRSETEGLNGFLKFLSRKCLRGGLCWTDQGFDLQWDSVDSGFETVAGMQFLSAMRSALQIAVKGFNKCDLAQFMTDPNRPSFEKVLGADAELDSAVRVLLEIYDGLSRGQKDEHWSPQEEFSTFFKREGTESGSWEHVFQRIAFIQRVMLSRCPHTFVDERAAYAYECRSDPKKFSEHMLADLSFEGGLVLRIARTVRVDQSDLWSEDPNPPLGTPYGATDDPEVGTDSPDAHDDEGGFDSPSSRKRSPDDDLDSKERKTTKVVDPATSELPFSSPGPVANKPQSITPAVAQPLLQQSASEKIAGPESAHPVQQAPAASSPVDTSPDSASKEKGGAALSLLEVQPANVSNSAAPVADSSSQLSDPSALQPTVLGVVNDFFLLKLHQRIGSYSGEAVNGLAHGQGTWTIREGFFKNAVYSGAWAEGTMHGQGKFTRGDTILEGVWNDEEFTGTLKKKRPDGTYDEREVNDGTVLTSLMFGKYPNSNDDFDVGWDYAYVAACYCSD